MRKFVFKLDNDMEITVNAPTVRNYHNFLESKTDAEIIESIATIINHDVEYVYDNFTIDDLSRFITEFPLWVRHEKQSDPN